MIQQTTLDQLGVCEHRYPSCLIVPHEKTFVATLWCLRCGEVSFVKYDDNKEEEFEDHPALD